MEGNRNPSFGVKGDIEMKFFKAADAHRGRWYAGLAVALICLVLSGPTPAEKETVEEAKPKKGMTVTPALSADPPTQFTELPRFGSIDWQIQELPWVDEGPYKGISGMGMVSHDGNVYVIGGFIPGGDGSINEASKRTSRWAWRYDPEGETWERLADAPFRREYVRAVADATGVYLIGGACQYKKAEPPYRPHADCARLDLSTQPPRWRTHSPLNVARTHTAVGLAGSCLVVAGGNEYAFEQKGYSHATIRKRCEVFDLFHPEKGWQVRAPIPGPGRGWAASVAAEECLYVFGGLTWDESNEPVGTRETLRYDPETDAWMKRTPPPLAISGWEGALYADRYVVIVGGVERKRGGVVWSDLVWVYDVQEDRWLRMFGVLPPGAVFNDPGVAVVGDTIYVAGAEGPHGSHYNYYLVGRIREDGNP